MRCREQTRFSTSSYIIKWTLCHWLLYNRSALALLCIFSPTCPKKVSVTNIFQSSTENKPLKNKMRAYFETLAQIQLFGALFNTLKNDLDLFIVRKSLPLFGFKMLKGIVYPKLKWFSLYATRTYHWHECGSRAPMNIWLSLSGCFAVKLQRYVEN